MTFFMTYSTYYTMTFVYTCVYMSRRSIVYKRQVRQFGVSHNLFIGFIVHTAERLQAPTDPQQLKTLQLSISQRKTPRNIQILQRVTEN